MYVGKYSNNQVCKMTAKLGYKLLHLHVKPYTYFLSYAQEMFLHENRIPLTTYQGIMYTNNNKLYITPTLLRVLCILIISEPQKLKTMTLSLTQGITKTFSFKYQAEKSAADQSKHFPRIRLEILSQEYESRHNCQVSSCKCLTK